VKKSLIAAALVLAGLRLSGCTMVNSEDVFSRYYRTTLGQSGSADVLGYIHDPKTELLSQTESMLASSGSLDDGKTHWFNMAVFDEERLTAVRKYGFVVEDYNRMNTKPRPTLRFDAEVMMDAETLGAAYPNKNAMRIELLKKVRQLFGDDSATITYDSAALRSSVMMARQALNTTLTKLDQSPALASKLEDLSGLEFDHISIGQARIRMLTENNIVKVKIKAGAAMFRLKPFESHPDVIDM